MRGRGIRCAFICFSLCLFDEANQRQQALDALKEGIVDWLGNLDDALKHLEEFNLVQKAQPGVSGKSVFGQIKQEMWRETIDYLENWSEDTIRFSDKEIQWLREKERREEKVARWEKSKL